ncbi:hypothetical protein ACKKBG_A14530 [Auxenochlorella protothecoides x Auxenochlorella symbiontica]
MSFPFNAIPPYPVNDITEYGMAGYHPDLQAVLAMQGAAAMANWPAPTGDQLLAMSQFLAGPRLPNAGSSRSKKNGHVPGPASNPLYKTELCRSWEETGSCRYGFKCQFAHGRGELRTVQRHRKYKTEACRSFAATGHCPYGSRCRFIHKYDGPPTTVGAGTMSAAVATDAAAAAAAAEKGGPPARRSPPSSPNAPAALASLLNSLTLTDLGGGGASVLGSGPLPSLSSPSMSPRGSLSFGEPGLRSLPPDAPELGLGTGPRYAAAAAPFPPAPAPAPAPILRSSGQPQAAHLCAPGQGAMRADGRTCRQAEACGPGRRSFVPDGKERSVRGGGRRGRGEPFAPEIRPSVDPAVAFSLCPSLVAPSCVVGSHSARPHPYDLSLILPFFLPDVQP